MSPLCGCTRNPGLAALPGGYIEPSLQMNTYSCKAFYTNFMFLGSDLWKKMSKITELGWNDGIRLN